MEVLVLNEAFEAIFIVDSFESLIWTDRYQSAGDFEIYCFPSSDILDNARADYYLVNPESEHVMIIEGSEITTDAEEGNRLIITGRSLESILNRRILYNQVTLSGNLQNEIKRVLEENIISPEDESRKIQNFVFIESEDPRITEIEIDTQYAQGQILYDMIAELCSTKKIGFKIVLTDDFKFAFSLYKGQDRSYEQDVNPYVIFSPNFENMINSDYIESKKDYKNVTLVAGEEVNEVRKTTMVGTVTGLLRREVFTDARDASSTKEDNSKISDEDYIKILEQRGHDKLKDYPDLRSFEGEVEASKMFVYGTDFFLGDDVQVENEYGMSGTSLISEIVWAHDADGYSVYPTFVTVQDEDEEDTEEDSE